MKTAILLHLHYQELWPEFWSYLKDIKDENTHLYVTVHTVETEWYNDIKNNSTEVFLIENKGADFGGFLYAYNKIKHIDYLTITKLHSKKGESSNGWKFVNSNVWRKKLYLPILKSKDLYNSLTTQFQVDNRLFICGNGECRAKWPTFQGNINKIREVNYLLDLKELAEEDFIGGSMYILSKRYLELFFNNKEIFFYECAESGYATNFTLGHVLENLLCSHITSFGGKIKFI